MNFKHVVKLAEIDHFFLTPLTVRNLPMQMFILGLQPISEIQKTMVWQPCWMTERFVLSSNMAAMPLSFCISRDWLQTKNTMLCCQRLLLQAWGEVLQ